MPKKIAILLCFGLTLCKKSPQKLWVEDINTDQHLISPRGLICCGASAAQTQRETRVSFWWLFPSRRWHRRTQL